jgi:hypothetical protein
MPTEFACIIDTDGVAGAGGVDFTSLAAWYSAMRNGPASGSLVLWSKDPIVVPGARTGTIPGWSTVTQDVTGVSAILICCTATQALLHHASAANQLSYLGGFDDAHPWRLDGSNYFTPSGPSDLAALKASCRGTAADASVLTWANLYSQSYANPITLEGDRVKGAPWSTSKFRWEFSSATGIVVPGGTSDHLVFRNLQVRNTNAATTSDAICCYYGKRAATLFDSCLLRGGKNPIYIETSQGRHVFHDTAAYGGVASGAALLNASMGAPAIARNCTLIGGAYGLRSTGGADCVAENTYAHGSTAAYAASGGGTIRTDHAASSDSTGSTGYRAIARDAATFASVAGGSEDWSLPSGSPLVRAGATLSTGRRRHFADVSSAAEGGAGRAPVGILAFESGSSVATFRLWDSVNDKWFDGTDAPYDLSMTIPLPYPSATSDWVAMVSDTHFGDVLKATAGPGIDALNAGTKGRWNRATSGAWTNNGFPCTGRLLHLFNIGDIGPTDRNDYGTGRATAGEQAAAGRDYYYYQENLWNTSGFSGGAGCQSIPAGRTWHSVGNHDTTAAMASASGDPLIAAHGGFETFRLNQHGRATSAYTGAAYADVDELHQHVDVGNNRFVLLNFYGSGAAGAWTAADTAWATWAAVTSLPAGTNLFLLPHAPPGHSTRVGKFDQPHDSAWECTVSTIAWAASFCGHCHGFTPGTGPDRGCVATRDDYPSSRSVWDVGAYESSPERRRLRGIRAGGRMFSILRA